ncbi:MAG TPA: response regulator [Phycisphaerae bacterium]|nr:response regulator [Phycisphaerae bacterium]
MGRRPAEILLIEDDSVLVEMAEQYLGEAVSSRITVTSSAEDALREELTCRHDLILVDLDLQTGDALELLRRLRGSNRCPVILLASEPAVSELLEAIHLGLQDVLLKPFGMEEMAGVVRRAIRARSRRRREHLRYRRLRTLTARILRDRRDLKERTDLICKDLVNAYRGLARKVTESGILT